MTKDQEWIIKHFEELVSKYEGKFVAVANEEIIAVGDSAKAVDDLAREKYPDIIPSVIHVPREENLTCIL
ncbi:MAG: DUF5678 domain-containing protein [Nitrospirota bacterium]